MSNSLFEPFRWQKDSEGYDLEKRKFTGTVDGKPFRSSVLWIVPRGGPLEFSRAEEHKDIHRIFADRVTDETSALEFVREFGFLGYLNRHASEILPQGEQAVWIVGIAERMRRALKRIDAVRFKPARTNAERVNRAKLLAGIFGRYESMSVSYHVTWKREDPYRPSESLRVTSLLSWMWAQVSQDITEGREWRTCPWCPRRYSVDLYDKRTTQRQQCDRPGCRKKTERYGVPKTKKAK
jgi:hypothetical protein